MIVNSIQCPKCKDRIFSRATHDMRSCTCGAVAIDGGQDYIKMTGSPKDLDLEIKGIKIKATKQQLYDDWKTARDKFGLIKEVK